MNLTHLMPHLAGCQVEEIRAQTGQLTLVVRLTRRTARCPVCARRSRRVHSWYQRTVADLPLAGRPLVLRARVRRFRCANRKCPRAIFAERWPRVAPLRARRTPDQQRALEHTAFALGGAAGARLAGRLGVTASRATLLRLVRAAPPPADVLT